MGRLEIGKKSEVFPLDQNIPREKLILCFLNLFRIDFQRFKKIISLIGFLLKAKNHLRDFNQPFSLSFPFHFFFESIV